MATYLQLCQKVASESGSVADTGTTLPSTVVGQTKRLGRIVRWVNDAWAQIQNAHSTWRWLQSEFYGPTVASTQRYAYDAAGFTDVAASAVISRFAEWIYDADPDCDSGFSLYDTTIGVSSEGPLLFRSWDWFYQINLRGSQSENKPSIFSITPDNKIILADTPDSANYRIRGRYRKDAQTLSANGDIPECPVRFHDVIVDVALMMLDTFDETPGRIPLVKMRQSQNFCALERDQLPRMELFGTLA